MNSSDSKLNQTAAMMVNPEFRRQLREGDSEALSKLGCSDGNVEYKVVTSAADTLYMAMPAAPSADGDLSADQLQSVQAAGAGPFAGMPGGEWLALTTLALVLPHIPAGDPHGVVDTILSGTGGATP